LSIKSAIKTKLESITQVSDAGASVYQHHAPQEASYPYIVFQRIPGGTQGNDLIARQTWAKEIFQIDIFDDNDDDCEVIRNGIIRDMHAQGTVTWGDTKIYVALITDQRDLSDLENEAGQTAIVRQSLDLQIKYKLA